MSIERDIPAAVADGAVGNAKGGAALDVALDADILSALAEGVAPADDDGGAIDRVRARLMKRIARDSVQHHLTIPADEGRWHTLLPGIRRKVLHESGGVMSYLLRFEPGAVLPAHRHPVDEECIVLEGTLCIGDMRLPAGSFHMVRANVLDADSTTDEGTLIYLRGASPREEQLV